MVLVISFNSVTMSNLLMVVPRGQQVMSVSCFISSVPQSDDTCHGFTTFLSLTT